MIELHEHHCVVAKCGKPSVGQLTLCEEHIKRAQVGHAKEVSQ